MRDPSCLHHFCQQLPIIGTIVGLDPEAESLQVKTRSGAVFVVHKRASTEFVALRNLDGLERRRDRNFNDPTLPTWHNLQVGDLVAVDGVYSRHADQEAYDAVCITELVSQRNYYLFEHTFWWHDQVNVMAERWLDNLFGDKAIYSIDDYAAFYRTMLNIQGQPVPQQGDLQEMATLSRLIYGFASAYMLTGEERFFQAAKAGVAYQREAFRSVSADGRFCFWLHARRRDREGRVDILPSQCEEDKGTLPLYEQIYALSGLAQFYRISNDWDVLHDMRRTITAFNTFFADQEPGGFGGFFSHIDPVRFSWDSPELDADPKHPKRGQKNWNSIGDHLPAYLVNLILALDPLPEINPKDPDAQALRQDLKDFLDICRQLLDETADRIARHFPQQDGNPYVIERFTRDWQPITSYGWQQNRAVVGHNLKIVWNLTRVAQYYRLHADHTRAERMAAVARSLGAAMVELGIDPIRSGVYDAVERQPNNGMPVQFAWLNTRDFWQQEQGILAYLVLFGLEAQAAGPSSSMPEAVREWLTLARELQAYWNLHFLDHARRGVFFRVSDNGQPVIRGTYADKGGHSISGYHVFELAFLAQVYQRAFLPRENHQHTGLTLHFIPSAQSRLRSINVLPDFLGPGQLKITEVLVDGVSRYNETRNGSASGALAAGQVTLHPQDLGRKLAVTLHQADAYHQATKPWAIRDGRPF